MRDSGLNRLFAVTVGFCAFCAAAPAAAGPTVTETTTGSAGNWTYDFSVTNTLGGTNNIYFFGVQDPGASLSGSPAGWAVWNGGSPWTNTGFGGSSNVYNLNWYTDPYSAASAIVPGQTLSGFDVLDTSNAPTTSFNWFAYAYGGSYSGGDNFNSSSNPGFEGTIGASTGAVPEPATWAMMLLGFGAIGFAMRRRPELRLARQA